MKTELKVFLSALMFYTRIPSPTAFDYQSDYLNRASKYFPVMGWLVGAMSAVALLLGNALWGIDLAIIFALMTGVLATGAFHEDGFADAFDGFGGGWNKTQTLEIMKDSRLGTYGTTALIFLFTIKFLGFKTWLDGALLSPYVLLLLLINLHGLARLTAISLVFTQSYAREDDSAKAKPIAKRASPSVMLQTFMFGLLPLAGLSWFKPSILLLLIPLCLLHCLSRAYFQKRLGGYTGDCLGAVEQFAEVIILLAYPLLWNSI